MNEAPNDLADEARPGATGSRFFGRRARLRSPSEALQPEAAPPPPPPRGKRKRSMLSSISGGLTFLLVLALAGFMAFGVLSKRFGEPGPLAASKVVLIARGSDVGDIADQLQREGIIASASTFSLALTALGRRGDVKAGEYMFNARASMRDVMNTLIDGKPIEHALTIPEGLTSQQIIQRLRDNDMLAGDVKETPKEGTLYPDTYKFPRGWPRERILNRMREKQEAMLNDIWARRAKDNPLQSKYELLTLASIVEKETGKADERARVAGVFINRLQKKMKLQSDPTIVYGLVGGRGTLGRGILRSEVLSATPYNTYVIAALPPGPIANPGRAAMEAVANPARTSDLYFVADGSGGHAFAATLDEHEKNVARWRQIEKDAKDRIEPDADKLIGAPPAPAPAPGRPQRRGAVEDGAGAVYGLLTPVNPLPPPPLSRGALARSLALAGPAHAWTQAYDEEREAERQATRETTRGEALAFANATTRRERVAALPFAAAAPGLTDPLIGPARPGGLFALAPGVDERSLPIAGLSPPSDVFGSDPDPDLPPASAGSPATWPVSAARMADIKARSAQYAGRPGPAPADEGEAAPTPAHAPIVAAAGPRPRAFDASEGTRLDPLLNRNYDLNSPKTVPDLKRTP